MDYVYPDLGKTGMGNMLLIWAEAYLYSRKNGAKMVAPAWCRCSRIGPWLRRERYKRFYRGEFTNRDYISGLKRWCILNLPGIRVRIFDKMNCFFDPIIGEHDILFDELIRIANPKILNAVKSVISDGPYIGVHIRRGDFSGTHMMTTDDWYIKAINKALSTPYAVGHKFIRIFSDEYPERLQFLKEAFPLENIVLMPKAPAIQDILLLANSSIAVCSSRSTFSMWGAYLRQIPSVWRDGDELVRPPRLYAKESLAIYV